MQDAVAVTANLKKIVMQEDKPTQFIFETEDERLNDMTVGEAKLFQDKPVDLFFNLRITAPEPKQKELPMNGSAHEPSEEAIPQEACWQCGGPIGTAIFCTDSGKHMCSEACRQEFLAEVAARNDHQPEEIIDLSQDVESGQDLFSTLGIGDRLFHNGPKAIFRIESIERERANIYVESTGKMTTIDRHEVNTYCTYHFPEGESEAQPPRFWKDGDDNIHAVIACSEENDSFCVSYLTPALERIYLGEHEGFKDCYVSAEEAQAALDELALETGMAPASESEAFPPLSNASTAEIATLDGPHESCSYECERCDDAECEGRTAANMELLEDVSTEAESNPDSVSTSPEVAAFDEACAATPETPETAQDGAESTSEVENVELPEIGQIITRNKDLDGHTRGFLHVIESDEKGLRAMNVHDTSAIQPISADGYSQFWRLATPEETQGLPSIRAFNVNDYIKHKNAAMVYKVESDTFPDGSIEIRSIETNGPSFILTPYQQRGYELVPGQTVTE